MGGPPPAHPGRAVAEHSRPGIFARGVAMGMAEAVPGVSGGTIAFITGIYDELVASFASFSHTSARTLLRDGARAFASRHNLAFLAILGGGMAVGLPLTLLVAMALLETHTVYATGFFFGLIAASVVHVGMQSSWRWLISTGALGVGLGAVLGTVPGVDTGLHAPVVFAAGALASTAWMLPGLSGAFVLVLLGLYRPMAQALIDGDLPVLATFVAGLLIGLVGFAKLLGWLLSKARGAVLALLTGLMAGSLWQLWPWRGVPPEDMPVAGVLLAIVVGALLVGLLGIAAARRNGKSW